VVAQFLLPSDPLATCTAVELNVGDPAVQVAVAAQAPVAVALAQVAVIAEAGILLHPAPPVNPAALTPSVQVLPFAVVVLFHFTVAEELPATLGRLVGLVAEKLIVAGVAVAPGATTTNGAGLLGAFAALAAETGWRGAFVCPHANPTVSIVEINTTSFREQFIPRPCNFNYAAEIVQVTVAV